MVDTSSKVSNVGVNIQEKSSVIWNIATALVGYFKPHEYGTVILPMTVIKRFHDCLLPTRDKTLAMYEDVKNVGSATREEHFSKSTKMLSL